MKIYIDKKGKEHFKLNKAEQKFINKITSKKFKEYILNLWIRKTINKRNIVVNKEYLEIIERLNTGL